MDKRSPARIYGVLGNPAKHSLSPLMHNSAFRALKIEAEYKIFEVEPSGLEDFLDTLAQKDIFGLNITIPYKIKTREILEKKFPSYQNTLTEQDLYYVKLSGAINTIKRDNDVLSYWNTDPGGFLESLEKDVRFDTKNKNVLLIGCGGAGRAIIASLSWKNINIKKIYINDISPKAIDSAKEHFSKLPQYPYLKDKIEFITSEKITEILPNCHLLVNASPIGMGGEDASPIDKNLLHAGLYVYDVVYNRETKLIKDARSLGLRAMNGLGMLLYQGARSFEIWTGNPAPLEIMRDALIKGAQICLRK